MHWHCAQHFRSLAGCLELNAEDLDFTPLKGHCDLFVMLLSMAKNLFLETQSLKCWFSFVNNNPTTTTQQLMLVIIERGWPRLKCIPT